MRGAMVNAVALLAVALLLRPVAAVEMARCPGDCDGDDVVKVDELLAGVRLAGGRSDGGAGAAADREGDGTVGVDELVRAVAAALDGCPLTRVAFTASLEDGALLV